MAIYQRVRPVDGFSPASTNFSVTTTQALAFSVALLQPATHNLNVQWFTNGVPRSDSSFTPFGLGSAGDEFPGGRPVLAH